MLQITPPSARDLYHVVRRGLFRSSPEKLLRDAAHVASVAGLGYSSALSAANYWSEPKQQLVRDLMREKLSVTRLPSKLTPVADRIAKALALREDSLPKTGKTIQSLTQPVSTASPLLQRLTAYRRRKYLAEAARRGLPTTLDLAKAGTQRLSIAGETRDEGHHVMLLHASGWAKYSSRVGSYPAALSLLCGHDDAGLWAVRVPGTIADVNEALAWLMPAAVRNAKASGKRVLRQGDVWVVERTRDAMATSEMPAGHRWDAEKRILWHDGHQRLDVPFPAVAIRQSTLAANGNGRRQGD